MLKSGTFAFLLVGVVLLSLSQSLYGQRDKKKHADVPEDLKNVQAEAYFVEGEKYFILEDYSKALLFFQRAVELNPDDPGIHFKIAEVLSKSNANQDLSMAIASIEVSLKLEKKNKYYYQLASELYAASQNFLKAASTLETMIKEVPGSEESLFDLAVYYEYANKKEDAIRTYTRAEGVFGVNETSSLQKQRILVDLGRANEAIAETEKLVQAFPDDQQYTMAFAELLSQNNQKARAIQLLENFVKNYSSNGNARLILSAMYKENGQADKGNALLSSAFDDPEVDLSTKVLVIGTLTTEIEAARSKGTPNLALEEMAVHLFRQLEESEPEDPNVSVIGAQLYLTIKKNEEARQLFKKAIRLGATGFESWHNLLVLESQDDQYDSLIVHSEKGLELFPNQAVLYYFNGYGHLRRRHYQEACFSLEQAKKLSTENPKLVSDINGMLGDAYNATHQYEKSDKAYDDALAIDPNNDFVLNNYSYYLSLRRDKLDKAEQMSAKLAKLFPENATYLDTYGWVLYMREKYKDARKVMEKATSLSRAGATHFEHYGDILYQLGDIDGAVKQWEKAKALGTNSEALNKKIANRKLN